MEKAVVRERAMVLATLGNGARSKSTGTRAKQASVLRQKLIDAQAYAEKRKKAKSGFTKNLAKETLADVIEGKKPLLITAHRDRDLLTALRIAKEFDLRIILDGAAEVQQVIDQVKAAKVPIILHPPLARANGELENASFETAAKLAKAKIPFCFQSSYESYVPKTRVVLFEAAIAAAQGLGMDIALRACTLDAAKILAVNDRLGSLDKGKDADVVLFDGDPFEYTSHVVAVIINGKIVSRKKR